MSLIYESPNQKASGSSHNDVGNPVPLRAEPRRRDSACKCIGRDWHGDVVPVLVCEDGGYSKGSRRVTRGKRVAAGPKTTTPLVSQRTFPVRHFLKSKNHDLGVSDRMKGQPSTLFRMLVPSCFSEQEGACGQAGQTVKSTDL